MNLKSGKDLSYRSSFSLNLRSQEEAESMCLLVKNKPKAAGEGEAAKECSKVPDSFYTNQTPDANSLLPDFTFP